MVFPIDWSSKERARWQKIAEQCSEWKKNNKTIVLATGVFDLFHQEHQKFLQKAKSAGDFLVVGVESDSRVQKIKGIGRPIHKAQQRLQQVSDFPSVDLVALLPEKFNRPEHHRALIALLEPDVLAVSSHSTHQEKKQAILHEFGGTLKVVHKHNPSISTTQILAKRT